MTENIIIFLVIFVLLLYLCFNSENTNKNTNQNQNNNQSKNQAKNQNKNQDKKDNFSDTSELKNEDITYIEATFDNLLNRIKELQVKCNIDPNSEKCKFKGIKSIDNELSTFTSKLREYTDNYQTPYIQGSKEKIDLMLSDLQNKDDILYNKFITTNEIDHLQENNLNILKNLDSNNQMRGFNINSPELHPTRENFQSVSNLAQFCGSYFIIPYQYKNFNNITMILNLQEECSPSSNNQMSFYLDNGSDNYQHLVTYKIDNIAYVDSSLLYNNLDLTKKSELIKKNVQGIEFEITSRELDFEANNAVLKSIQNVLDFLNFNIKKKFLIFMVNEEYDKIFYNQNFYFGPNTDKYFRKTNRKVYRIYDQYNKSLLSMLKND